MYDSAWQEKLFKGIEYTPKTPSTSMQTKIRNQEKNKTGELEDTKGKLIENSTSHEQRPWVLY